MKPDYSEEIKYLRVKKRVEDLKGFYIHLGVYIVINIFISGIILFGLTENGEHSFSEAFTHFGTYSTWVFWGIGLAFHALKVFGFDFFLGKDWEERKIKKLMENKEKENNIKNP